MTLSNLQRLFADAGCQKLYAKPLAENDNSKNQIYFGPGFEALNLFPIERIIASDDPDNSTFKAQLNFGWLLPSGAVAKAPYSQLILYPQYPEVRMSGFLRGASPRPSHLMNSRIRGRVLFLGVASQQVLGIVAGPRSSAAAEFRRKFQNPTLGVFYELSLPTVIDEATARRKLLADLRRVHRLGWIDSKQLAADGTLRPCSAPQCGGLTLEAELGIGKNSRSEPDLYGWEIKQHAVANFEREGAGPITLMTPEPTGGFYREEGVEAFVRRFGYSDRAGRDDRLNFGGIHKAGVRHARTGLTLTLVGYDNAHKRLVDADGALALVNDKGIVAASWNFSGLLKHWIRKHAKAAYVPSRVRQEPRKQYCYGHQVRLAVGTDFLRFLKALADGGVYYDPGIKVEHASSTPRIKRRSQFRVSFRSISSLYETVEVIHL